MNSLQKKWNKRTLARNVITCLFVALILSMMTVNVFAVSVTWNGQDPNAAHLLNTPALKQIMNIITTLVNPVASVVVGLCIFGIIFSSNSKQAETLINVIKSVIIGFFLINGIKMFLYFALWSAGAGTHIYTVS